MINVTVTVPKEIRLDAHLRGSRFTKLRSLFSFYLWRFCLIYIVVISIDNNDVRMIQSTLLVVMFLAFCLFDYIVWRVNLSIESTEYSFDAGLDDDGVHVNSLTPWSYYKSIKEYEKYYLIKDLRGVSVLPKTEELAEAINFSIEKISAQN